MPHVFIDAEAGDAVEAGLVLSHRLQQRTDRLPDRAPGRPELPGQPEHARVFTADLTDRPPARPGGQQRPGARDRVVLLGEHPGRAARLDASPDPLAPAQFNRPAEARRVDQPNLAAAVAGHHDPADPAALDPRRRLDHHPQHRPALTGHLLHAGHVQAGETNETVAAGAVATGRTRARARRTLRHRRGLPIEKLGRFRSLGGLDPLPATQPRVSLTPTSGTKKPLF